MTLKSFGDENMLTNYDDIGMFLIYTQFRAIW